MTGISKDFDTSKFQINSDIAQSVVRDVANRSSLCLTAVHNARFNRGVKHHWELSVGQDNSEIDSVLIGEGETEDEMWVSAYRVAANFAAIQWDALTSG